MFREAVHRISLLLAFLVFSLFIVSEVTTRTLNYFFPIEPYWVVIIDSVIVAILVFVVGLVIVRDSLKPTYEMIHKLETFNLHASHELKTPLANILASLDLALRTRKEKHVIAAKESVLAMSQDIDNMLALTQVSSDNIAKKRVNVTSLIQNIVDAIRSTIGAQHGFEIIESGRLYLNCDPGLVTHIVRNLMTNAIKYSAPQSTIKITVKNRYLKIEDEGEGMSEAFQKNAFELFTQQTTSNSKGQGIGLSLVKRICDAHGWDIDLQSKLGVGTQFTIFWNAKSPSKLKYEEDLY